MTLTGKKSSGLSQEQVALADLLTADPIQCAHRIVVYPKEAEGVIGAVRTGRHHTLHASVELVGAETAALCASLERNVTFALLGYD
jgi:hypothetical protein